MPGHPVFDGDFHPPALRQGAFMEGDVMSGSVQIDNEFLVLFPSEAFVRDEDSIIEGMEDNLCRCGAHTRIIRAIESASKMMKGVPQP